MAAKFQSTTKAAGLFCQSVTSQLVLAQPNKLLFTQWQLQKHPKA